MLARYTRPNEERKAEALTLGSVVTNWSQGDSAPAQEAEELKKLLGKLVDGTGIEPVASALRTRRSPS